MIEMISPDLIVALLDKCVAAVRDHGSRSAAVERASAAVANVLARARMTMAPREYERLLHEVDAVGKRRGQ
jgi:hypothetical protein